MSLDLKRQLVAQLVESSRLLRNFIDHRAKSRGTTRAQWIVLFRLRQQEGLSQVDLAGAAARSPGRAWPARTPSRSEGPPRQPALPDREGQAARRRSRQPARRD